MQELSVTTQQNQNYTKQGLRRDLEAPTTNEQTIQSEEKANFPYSLFKTSFILGIVQLLCHQFRGVAKV